MSIALGFGSVERDFTDAESDAIKNQARELLDADPDGLVATLSDWLDGRAQALRDDADFWASADDHPDRYSYYWPRIVLGASDVVVILRIHHINRRSPMSPDGWALLSEHALVHIPLHD